MTYAGLRTQSRNRLTGYLTSVYNCAEAGIDGGDNKWACVCEDTAQFVPSQPANWQTTTCAIPCGVNSVSRSSRGIIHDPHRLTDRIRPAGTRHVSSGIPALPQNTTEALHELEDLSQRSAPPNATRSSRTCTTRSISVAPAVPPDTFAPHTPCWSNTVVAVPYVVAGTCSPTRYNLHRPTHSNFLSIYKEQNHGENTKTPTTRLLPAEPGSAHAQPV